MHTCDVESMVDESEVIRQPVQCLALSLGVGCVWECHVDDLEEYIRRQTAEALSARPAHRERRRARRGRRVVGRGWDGLLVDEDHRGANSQGSAVNHVHTLPFLPAQQATTRRSLVCLVLDYTTIIP